MKLSAKAEYACLAVLELALRAGRPEPARAAEIAETNRIPQRFLVQILLQLKGAGFVASVRGAAGGYRLAVPAESISLWDVIQTIDGATSPPALAAGTGVPLGWQVLNEVWEAAARREEAELRQIHFGRLVARAAQAGDEMYYI